MLPPSLSPERAKVAEFYSAGSGTIPPLPWQTFPPPFSEPVDVGVLARYDRPLPDLAAYDMLLSGPCVGTA